MAKRYSHPVYLRAQSMAVITIQCHILLADSQSCVQTKLFINRSEVAILIASLYDFNVRIVNQGTAQHHIALRTIADRQRCAPQCPSAGIKVCKTTQNIAAAKRADIHRRTRRHRGYQNIRVGEHLRASGAFSSIHGTEGISREAYRHLTAIRHCPACCSRSLSRSSTHVDNALCTIKNCIQSASICYMDIPLISGGS